MKKYFRICYNEKFGNQTYAVARGETGFDAYCNLGHPPMGYRQVSAIEITELEYKAERI